MEIFQNYSAEGISIWLTAHASIAYLVLFFGSYFETLIGTGFFVYGELFFLPGAMLAGAGVLNVWLVAFFLVSGGALGDSSSYLIGRKIGIKIFREDRKIFSLTNYQKGEAFFHKYGNKSIFFARLLGPLSWITPFFSGVYKVPYRKFVMYNVPGVCIGIGEFIIIGYFFGAAYKQVLAVVQQNVGIVLFLVFVVVAVAYIIKRNDTPMFLSKLWKRLM